MSLLDKDSFGEPIVPGTVRPDRNSQDPINRAGRFKGKGFLTRAIAVHEATPGGSDVDEKFKRKLIDNALSVQGKRPLVEADVEDIKGALGPGEKLVRDGDVYKIVKE